MSFLRQPQSLISSSFHMRPSSHFITSALSARKTTSAIPAQRLINPATTTTTISTRTYASQDYGSGQGDPKGENPQQQGSNPSADIEHPGPPPPASGQGSGSGPTKGTSDGHNSGSSPSAPGSGQRQGQASGSGGSGSGSGSGSEKTGKGAQPKILRDSLPAEPDEDVKQHNWELSQRAERAHERLDDDSVGKEKVPKGYWSGQGGADRTP